MEVITQEEFNDIISEYILLIKDKIYKFTNKYYNEYFERSNEFINIFERNCLLLDRFRNMTYNNCSKKTLIKIKSLRDEEKLKDIFICCCGAIHTTFKYNHFIDNHQRIFRHTNFIKRHPEVEQLYESPEFVIINYRRIEEQRKMREEREEERKQYIKWKQENNYSSESSESESDSSEDEL